MNMDTDNDNQDKNVTKEKQFLIAAIGGFIGGVIGMMVGMLT